MWPRMCPRRVVAIWVLSGCDRGKWSLPRSCPGYDRVMPMVLGQAFDRAPGVQVPRTLERVLERRSGRRVGLGSQTVGLGFAGLGSEFGL